MKKVLIAVAVAVLGAGAHAALADPSTNSYTLPNTNPRNATESTDAKKTEFKFDWSQYKPAYQVEQERPFYFN